MVKRLTYATLFCAAALLSRPALAADHADGTPTALNVPDGSSDITDVFTWTADATHVNLVMDVFPGAATGSKFSDKVQYVFHTRSTAGLTATTSTAANVICTFSTAQVIKCWITDMNNVVLDYVTGDASVAAGISSTSGKIKVFAGLRDDPFFFNLAGFRNAAKAVAGALKHGVDATNGPITAINANGCPTLNAATATALPTVLKQDSTNTKAGLDFFAKPTAGSPPADQPLTGNILGIVLVVDKTLLNTGGAIVGVWGSTNKGQ